MNTRSLHKVFSHRW